MQYIDKAALVVEIEKRRIDEIKQLGEKASYEVGLVDAYKIILSILDTLEVKEVDLEKEIDNYVNEHFSECDDGVLISDANSLELTLFDIIPMAKHFFELGLKVQKGE